MFCWAYSVRSQNALKIPTLFPFPNKKQTLVYFVHLQNHPNHLHHPIRDKSHRLPGVWEDRMSVDKKRETFRDGRSPKHPAHHHDWGT